MGRSYTPKFVVKVNCCGMTQTPFAWHTKHYGRPNAKNLAKFCREENTSYQPGGEAEDVTRTFGPWARITGAVLYDQWNNKVVAKWQETEADKAHLPKGNFVVV